jgi:DDB1- and CUL4-associated factor 11
LNGWDNRLGTVSLHSFNEGDQDEGYPEMGTGYNERMQQVGGDDDDDHDELEDDGLWG